jgi:alkylhydroperoxidase family enzyme
VARVSAIEESAHPELAGLIAKIRGARGGRLLNFYRALLHSPALAATWMEFNNAVRYQAGIDARLRELAIMRVALLNGVSYVFDIHKARYAAPAGVTPAEISALPRWKRSRHFGPREQALLGYVDAMTRDVEVPDRVFDALRPHFSEREIVELTVLIAAYNLHTRVLQALRVDPELL